METVIFSLKKESLFFADKICLSLFLQKAISPVSVDTTYQKPCFLNSVSRYWFERRVNGTRKYLCGLRGGRDGVVVCSWGLGRGGRGGAFAAVRYNNNNNNNNNNNK